MLNILQMLSQIKEIDVTNEFTICTTNANTTRVSSLGHGAICLFPKKKKFSVIIQVPTPKTQTFQAPFKPSRMMQ